MYVRYEHFFFFFFSPFFRSYYIYIYIYIYFFFPFFFFFFSFLFFPIFIFQFSFLIFQFSRPFPVFNCQFLISDFHFPGVLALDLGENRTFCAIVSREFYWTSTVAMRGGAAVMTKPRDTLTVRLCFMDVSNCARLRPFPLGGLVGRVCKQLGSPVDDLLPASSRACVL